MNIGLLHYFYLDKIRQRKNTKTEEKQTVVSIHFIKIIPIFAGEVDIKHMENDISPNLLSCFCLLNTGRLQGQLSVHCLGKREKHAN